MKNHSTANMKVLQIHSFKEGISSFIEEKDAKETISFFDLFYLAKTIIYVERRRSFKSLISREEKRKARTEVDTFFSFISITKVSC